MVIVGEEEFLTASRSPACRVHLMRDGPFLFVEPATPEVQAALADLRTTRIVTGVSSNGHGYCSERVSWEMFQLQPDGSATPEELVCWAGLTPVVRRLLAQAGLAVADDGPEPAVLPAPTRTLLKKLDQTDEPFLDLVRRRDRGLVIHNPAAVCPARLVVQLALAWPGLKIAVAVKRIDEAYRLRRQLRRHLGDVECYHTDHHPEKSARVAVATYDFLDHAPVELAWRDLVVVLNAREGGCPEAQQQLARALRARLFGLLPVSEESSPFEMDQLTKLYGFERLISPGHGRRLQPVQTLLLRATGKVAVSKKAPLLSGCDWRSGRTPSATAGSRGWHSSLLPAIASRSGNNSRPWRRPSLTAPCGAWSSSSREWSTPWPWPASCPAGAC